MGPDHPSKLWSPWVGLWGAVGVDTRVPPVYRVRGTAHGGQRGWAPHSRGPRHQGPHLSGSPPPHPRSHGRGRLLLPALPLPPGDVGLGAGGPVGREAPRRCRPLHGFPPPFPHPPRLWGTPTLHRTVGGTGGLEGGHGQTLEGPGPGQGAWGWPWGDPVGGGPRDIPAPHPVQPHIPVPVSHPCHLWRCPHAPRDPRHCPPDGRPQVQHAGEHHRPLPR